ncbi:MAG: glycosyltransferase [Chitinophagales bacterium]|nr:glycosyltransferase [Hyphomicrobiales bacterium]
MPLLHVIFINYHEFSGASGIHIYHLGRQLSALNVSVSACIPGDPASIERFGPKVFDVDGFGFADAAKRVKAMRAGGRQVLLHAWTPREKVRKFTSRLARNTGATYLVHLEDNEHHIADVFHALQPKPTLLNWRKRWRASQNVAHPEHMAHFLKGAAGVTCLTEKLLEHSPAGVPTHVFWPGAEAEFFAIPPRPDQAIRAELGVAPHEFALTYPGNTHPANFDDMATLYDAIAALNAGGHAVRLIRVGADHRLGVDRFGVSNERPWLTHLGDRPARELVRYISAADALVQPGAADAFNDYRFPSKLTLFFASGRPVVLPFANIGRHVRDAAEALVLASGDSGEIARQILRLKSDAALRQRVGAAGRAFAHQHFHWPEIAKTMTGFYETVLANSALRRAS